ncbi:MAG: hypothetical protein WB511_06535 [Nitrososphaeraceae archaeon]
MGDNSYTYDYLKSPKNLEDATLEKLQHYVEYLEKLVDNKKSGLGFDSNGTNQDTDTAHQAGMNDLQE